MEMVMVSGKRKTSVAKAKIFPGKGSIVYKGVPYENIRLFHKLSLMEPVEIAKSVLGKFDYDIDVKVSGGGTESQIQAGRLAIAKAIVQITNSQDVKKAMVDYDRNILVADVRRKETRKPGDSKARAMRQSSKR